MKLAIHRALLAATAFGWLSLTAAHAQLTVSWTTQYGTTESDSGLAITVDGSGRSWVSGSWGGARVFLSRISASGNVEFTRMQEDPDNFVQGDAVALVGSDTVFTSSLTGLFSTQAVLLRYDTSNGNAQPSTPFSPGFDNFPNAMAGNATHLLVAGSANPGFLLPFDAFLTKRDNTGAEVWTRTIGTLITYGEAAAFDPSGNAYLAGYTQGSLSGFTNAGGEDIFFARYDATGTQTLLKQIGTGSNESAHDMKVGSSGNIYITGTAEGSLLGQLNAGGKDAFVMALDSLGNVLWTRLLGGALDDESFGLGLDAAGNLWVGGSSFSTFDGHTNDGLFADAFLALLDPAGNLLGTTWFSSPAQDVINGVAIGPDGAAYVTGFLNGSPIVSSADIFAAKVVPEASSMLLSVSGAIFAFARRRR